MLDPAAASADTFPAMSPALLTPADLLARYAEVVARVGVNVQSGREAGVIFHDTLYDENSGAHVAWGQAFPMCMPEGAAPELLNTAPVHTDVVVGGPGVSITGAQADGTRIPLTTDDVWALG